MVGWNPREGRLVKSCHPEHRNKPSVKDLRQVISGGQKGMSLIEVVIVASLIAIWAGLATAYFANQFRDRSEEHMIKDLKAGIRYLQFKAIEEGKTYQLKVSGSEAGIESYVQDPWDGTFKRVSHPFLARFEEQGQFRVKFQDGNDMYFFPNGVVTKNHLNVSDGDEKVATIEIQNRIGSMQVVHHG
jgi:prepilin-type N-terminal cleavage/methylation domain-containing protein